MPNGGIERKISQLDTLIEMTSLICSSFDIREIERRTMTAATRLLECEAGGLLLLDKETGELYFREAVGEKTDEVIRIRIDGKQGIAGAVVQSGRPLLIDDARSDPRFYSGVDASSGFVTRNMICVPVKIKGESLGALQAINKRNGRFTEDDVVILHALANQVAVALENSSLTHQACTDSLTGLHHHKFFETRLEEEVERARRYRHPVSLLMADIDFFKQVNDTHGHLNGDEVLSGFASLFQRTLRESDILARYGGEEFAAILPHTPLDNAVLACERLRSAVEHTPFAGINITVSIGVGEYRRGSMPPDARELVRRVDEALYRAKRNGRNRVERVTAG